MAFGFGGPGFGLLTDKGTFIHLEIMIPSAGVNEKHRITLRAFTFLVSFFILSPGHSQTRQLRFFKALDKIASKDSSNLGIRTDRFSFTSDENLDIDKSKKQLDSIAWLVKRHPDILWLLTIEMGNDIDRKKYYNDTREGNLQIQQIESYLVKKKGVYGSILTRERFSLPEGGVYFGYDEVVWICLSIYGPRKKE